MVEPQSLVDSAGLRIDVESPLHATSIRARAGVEAIRDALAAAGLEAPAAPNHFSGDASRACAWIEPQAWLLLSQSPLAVATAGALITDLSDRFIGFRLRGAGAPEILQAGLSIGATARLLATGRCARARFGEEIEAFVQQLSDAPEYRLLLDVSLARYAKQWLADAADLLSSRGPVR